MTAQELVAALMEKWRVLPQVTLRRLIQCIQACITAEGGHTLYTLISCNLMFMLFCIFHSQYGFTYKWCLEFKQAQNKRV